AIPPRGKPREKSKGRSTAPSRPGSSPANSAVGTAPPPWSKASRERWERRGLDRRLIGPLPVIGSFFKTWTVFAKAIQPYHIEIFKSPKLGNFPLFVPSGQWAALWLTGEPRPCSIALASPANNTHWRAASRKRRESPRDE